MKSKEVEARLNKVLSDLNLKLSDDGNALLLEACKLYINGGLRKGNFSKKKMNSERDFNQLVIYIDMGTIEELEELAVILNLVDSSIPFWEVRDRVMATSEICFDIAERVRNEEI